MKRVARPAHAPKLRNGPAILIVNPEVRRVFAEPNAPRAWTDTQGNAKLSDKNLASKGFTKYVKTDKGTYEKTAGDGPKKLKRK